MHRGVIVPVASTVNVAVSFSAAVALVGCLLMVMSPPGLMSVARNAPGTGLRAAAGVVSPALRQATWQKSPPVPSFHNARTKYFLPDSKRIGEAGGCGSPGS